MMLATLGGLYPPHPPTNEQLLDRMDKLMLVFNLLLLQKSKKALPKGME